MQIPEDTIWSVNAGRLAFRPNGGEPIYPAATEIWASVFDNAQAVCGVPVKISPAKALPEISFSRFPAEPALLLSGNLWQGIRASLAVKAGDVDVPHVLPEGNSIPDQLVIDGCWYPIDSGSIADSLVGLRSHGVVPNGNINLGQLVWLRGASDLGLDVIDRTEANPAGIARLAGPSIAKVEGLDAKLYPYQDDGVAFLRIIAQHSLGCILGDEMGLGKTMQVIALVQDETNRKRSPSLVIAPATLLENWRRELATFAPGLSVLLHAGAGRFGAAAKLAAFDVVITSYETALRDEPMLSSIPWNVLAIDEAQNIKNPDAQRTLSVKRLPRRVSLAVTGTPVENRLTDLWSLADFALPGLLGKLNDFRSEYDDNATDASRLAPVVAPIMLRRRVAEVAQDLPPRIDIPQVVSMTRALAEEYERVRQQAEAEYGAAAGLVSLQRLRMFCAHPRLLGLWDSDPALLMPKYLRLLEVLEEIFSRGEKVLIFSSFTEMADILLQDLPNRFPGGYFNWIDGRVAITERQPIVDRFSEFAGAGILVLNPKAAGVGLNITAANHVVHYNPEWNPAVEDQASARAYRRKQIRPVTVHHLYFADSVEEVVVDRLNFKRGLAVGAVTGHKGDASAADVMRALKISPLSNLDRLQ